VSDNYFQRFEFKMEGGFSGTPAIPRPVWTTVATIAFKDEEGYEFGPIFSHGDPHELVISVMDGQVIDLTLDGDEEYSLAFPKSALPGIVAALQSLMDQE
jgi:hypothetical protein